MQKDTLNRNQILSDKLDKAIRLNRMFLSEDFKVVLLPALKEACNPKLPSPLEYQSEAEFLRAYNLVFSKAQAYNELINLFESAEEQIKKIKLELGQPEKNWETGK